MGTGVLRTAALAAALVVLAPSAARPEGAASLVPDPALRGIERAAGILARGGRKAEVAEAIDLLKGLGRDADAVAKLREQCDKTLAKAAKPAPSSPDAAKALRKAASEIAAVLGDAPEAERVRLAGLVLRLDGTLAPAHEALGRVEHEGRWVPREVRDCLLRRKEIEAAVRDARRLAIEVESGPSGHAVVKALTGKEGVSVRACGVTLHSSAFTEERLRRMLLDILRASALSQFLRRGTMEVPPLQRPVTAVLLGSGALYGAAVKEAFASGGVEPARRALVEKVRSFVDRRGHVLVSSPFESDVMACVLYHVWDEQVYRTYGDSVAPALEAGHLNWILLTCLGTSLPGIAWTEEKETKKPGGGTTSDRPIETVERELLFRLARGGIAGTRAWMTWLARRREDPAWSRCFVDHVGKLEGPDLAKTTMVVEFLQEAELLENVIGATRSTPTAADAYEKVLGQKLGEFEVRWRDWLLPGEPGLADRVDGAGTKVAASPADRALLDRLDRMRNAAMYDRDRERLVPLSLDPDLTAGCRLHAKYLAKHPEQAAAWPDAHEEYSDREGFTAEGARAGGASVIAPGVRSADEAVDGWMATFYHRLPLLDPGLVRIGFGLEGGNAVLDSGSLVAPMDIGTWCVWPPPGARDVPRRFAPELPNPVPGADQAAWGHPVTVQFFGWDEEPPVAVRLSLGGKPVDCHVSTPREPSNPELAPDGVWCLIPKQTLQPGATYTVVVDRMPQLERFEWTFTTGR